MLTGSANKRVSTAMEIVAILEETIPVKCVLRCYNQGQLVVAVRKRTTGIQLL
jgi:hypothetical protein